MKMMNRLLFICVMVFVSVSCYAQPADRKYYNSDFKWKRTLPENFEKVPGAEWRKQQSSGMDAMSEAYGQKVEDNTTTIFVIKSGDNNYLEALHQPFDPAKDGDYQASCKVVDDVLYKTFKTQLPDAKLDTTITTEMIGGLKFNKFVVNLQISEDVLFTGIMYSRLFGKKELAVNIMYVDAEKGKAMMAAWKSSVFGKQ
jgi:hypothetical protein